MRNGKRAGNDRSMPRRLTAGGNRKGSGKTNKSGWRRVLSRENIGLVLTFAGLTVGIYIVFILGEPSPGIGLGEPASRNFRAPVAFTTKDLDATRLAREKARRSAPLVFETNDKFEEKPLPLRQVFEEGGDSKALDNISNKATRRKMRSLLPRLRREKKRVSRVLELVENAVLASPIGWDRARLRMAGEAIIEGEASEEKRKIDMAKIVPIDAQSERFRALFSELIKDLSDEEQKVFLSAAEGLLEAEVKLDEVRTTEIENQAAEAVVSVRKEFPEGALLVKRGEEVRRQHLVQLSDAKEKYMRSAAGQQLRFQHLVGVAVVVLVLMAAVGFYLSHYQPELVHSNLQRLSFALITLVLVGSARLFAVLGFSPYLAPVPLMVMVLCLVYDQRFGFEMGALYAVLVGLAQGGGMAFVVLMLGAMTAALLTGNVRTRSELIKTGLVVGCAQWAAALGLGLYTSEGEIAVPLQFWGNPLVADSLWALGNGLMSGFLVSGLLPAIEHLFGVSTDIRLLEWSDPNQPLLQRLLLEAPGTYHHSMVVGSLGADAAEAIGANPLLARVSAYFHDIGKLKKPEYFAENMPNDQKNPHDDLSPTMSKLIITAHPRDGAEMAEQHGLPGEVQRIILESHGSTMTRYFWDRAKEQQEGEDQKPKESTFRYRLPTPSNKESACIMLADAVESATRSMESPSPGQIKDIVHKIIMDRLHDGQLNESGLTITDLNRVEETLVRGLSGVFHSRIRYPDQEEESEEKEVTENESTPDRNQQPAK